MSLEELAVFGAVALLASVFSGISGGGGGFITTPTLILLGLSPAQAVSSGKFVGLSVAVGSLGGMRQATNHKLRRRALPIILLAFIIGLLAPLAIVNFESEAYRRVLGVLLLLMIPVLLFKKVGLKPQPTTKAKRYIGGALLAVALWLQGVFSGGLGSLVNMVLMGFLGMSAIEANITKRYAQLVLNVVIVLGVLGTGLVQWPVVVVGVVMAFIGSYLGGKIAVKRGNKFVMGAFMMAMFISGIVLLFG